jgi:hypothetical protein
MTTIIFDLGGVLLDWNPHRLYAPSSIPTPKSTSSLKENQAGILTLPGLERECHTASGASEYTRASF